VETPEGRADRLIDDVLINALGPVERFRKDVVKARIWQVIEEEKMQAISAEAEDGETA
jgi:hypothetical protein